MNKFLLPLLLIILEFVFVRIFSPSWTLFDSVLALVVIYTFFHSLDVREYVVFALFCGFCRDIFSLDVFGIHMLSYMICAFGISIAARVLYRHNWVFVFPLVFIAVFLNSQVSLLLKLLFFNPPARVDPGWFLLRDFVQAVGTTIFSYPLLRFSRRCAPELVG